MNDSRQTTVHLPGGFFTPYCILSCPIEALAKREFLYSTALEFYNDFMLDPRSYHIRKLEDFGEVTTWEINGEKLRAEKDIEFTNFGIYPDFDYIPKNELWMDKEAHPDERQFFIDHMLTQWKYLKNGYDNDLAIDKAYKKEASERQKAGDKNKVFDRAGGSHPENVHLKQLGNTKDGLEVWLINGRLVRSAYFIDFVDGGHHLIYPWVPEKEVWIDDDLRESEIPFVLLHELHERRLMAKGWSYNRAHPSASKIEFFCHHHPEKLPSELSHLGWNT